MIPDIETNLYKFTTLLNTALNDGYRGIGPYAHDILSHNAIELFYPLSAHEIWTIIVDYQFKTNRPYYIDDLFMRLCLARNKKVKETEKAFRASQRALKAALAKPNPPEGRGGGP